MINFDNFEVSDKPAKHGWAPGYYYCECRSCRKTYSGQKRSYECAACAYDETIQRHSIFDLTQKEIDEINKEIDRLIERKSLLNGEK